MGMSLVMKLHSSTPLTIELTDGHADAWTRPIEGALILVLKLVLRVTFSTH